jgi:hypothetical protein
MRLAFLQYPCRRAAAVLKRGLRRLAGCACSKSDHARRHSPAGFLGACGLGLLLLFHPAQAARAAQACASNGVPLGEGVAERPALQPLGPDRWWVAAERGEPDAANAGRTAQLLLVRDGARLWLVGSGPTPAFGAALACAVRQTVQRAVTDIVNTRAAPELAMGNAAFPGARLWALPDVARAMQARCLGCQQRLKAQIGAAGASLTPLSIRVPTRHVGVDGQATGRLGPFDWLALPRNASERTLVLRVRADRRADAAPVVLAQGLLWVGDVPDLRGTQADTLRGSWRTLRDWVGDSAVLGEQGGWADGSAIDAHSAYLQALQAVVEPALARGDLWGAAPLDLPAWQALPGYGTRHPLNVQHLWLALEPTIFR